MVPAFKRANWSISKDILDWVRSAYSAFGATWNAGAFGKGLQCETKMNQSHEMADRDIWQTLSFCNVLSYAGFTQVAFGSDGQPVAWPESLFHVEHQQPAEKLRKNHEVAELVQPHSAGSFRPCLRDGLALR